MINQKLLVSGADFFSIETPINPYYTTTIINRQKAIKEHAGIIECFKTAGIEVIKVKPPENCQDGVYTANWAIVHQGTAILSRLPSVRKPEEPYAKSTLAWLEPRLNKILEIPRDYLFSGQGDALICGPYLFAGSQYRSDKPAQEFVAHTLGLQLIQLHTVPKRTFSGKTITNPFTRRPESYFYDLDLALAIIDPQTIAYCPQAFDQKSQSILANLPLQKILVDYEEAQQGFACNLVSTGQTIIMSDQAPKLQAQLQNLGLKTLTPHITELKKGGGFIRCISLTLDLS